MRILKCIVIALVLFSFVVGQKAETSVEDLSFMSGCWEKKGKAEGSLTSERWTKPAGMMLGIGYSLKEGRISSYEYLRIIKKDADIYYVAKPASAKAETFFKLTALEKKRAVFENPEHDFPQRIVYHLVDEKTMGVRVEADKNGKPQGFGYALSKTDCD